jgi:hypothetical protein
MSGLVYHPAFDPYASVLRCVRYLVVEKNAIPKEQIRLFDFLLLFPEHIGNMRLTTSLRSAWSKVNYRRKFAYEERPSTARLFEAMEVTFEAAFQTLLSKGIVELNDENGLVILKPESLPPGIFEIANVRNEEDAELVNFLALLGNAFSFHGADGLKDRSKLMEFRYDIV